MNAPSVKTAPSYGLVYDLSNEDYHAHPAISKSGLFDFASCPANFFALHLAEDRPAIEETAWQRTGTLLHTLVLEPSTFESRYAVGPDANRNSKAWKDFADSVTDGRALLKPSEYEEGKRQAESLLSHSEVREAMTSGRAEVSAFWIDEETGVQCRCRPDWVYDLGEPGVILMDVKTGNPDPDIFRLQAAKLGYDIQDAMYSEGYEAASRRKVLAFVFAIVDPSYPYLSSCCVLDDDSRESGKRKYRALLNKYAECKKTNQWPGWNGIQTIRLPNYAIDQTGE